MSFRYCDRRGAGCCDHPCFVGVVRVVVSSSRALSTNVKIWRVEEVLHNQLSDKEKPQRDKVINTNLNIAHIHNYK